MNAGANGVLEQAQLVCENLAARNETVAVAESFTGGLLAATLVEVPGASKVFRGGVVSYATDLKASLLSVAPDLLAAHGPIHPEVAAQMAIGVRRICTATWGIATTGVAGPDPQDGHQPGECYLAIAHSAGCHVQQLQLSGTRNDIRNATVSEVLRIFLTHLEAS